MAQKIAQKSKIKLLQCKVKGAKCWHEGEKGAEGKGHAEVVAGEAKQQQHQPGNFVARGVRELLLMNTLTHTLTHILTHTLALSLQSELSASLKKIYQ